MEQPTSNTIDVRTVFGSLVEMLDKCISAKESGEKSLHSLSEDTICFFLAESFVRSGASPHSIEMEVRNPTLQEISWTTVDISIGRTTWIEVKFDKVASRSHYGKLLIDLFRLALIREGRCLMLYVAPEKMVDLLGKENSRHLSMDSYTPNAELLDKLPESVEKKLNTPTRRKLHSAKPMIKLIGCRLERSPICLFYEVDASN